MLSLYLSAVLFAGVSISDCRALAVAAPTATRALPKQLKSFGEIDLSKYDAFLLDQFGVLHDGKECYPGSAELVRSLQEQGKRIVVLSNSSKRRRDTIERLQGLKCGMCTFLDAAEVVSGIPAISVFTSGDLVHDALKAIASPNESPGLFESLRLKPGANRAFVFGNGDDDDMYLRSAEVFPSGVEEADYLLARGLFCTLTLEGQQPLAFSEKECDETLSIAAARGIPMIVANPDLVRPDGDSSPMPGLLAKRYEDKFQGKVLAVGKPHASIYQAAIRRALPDVDLSRICAVGDSMHHDILGACDAGVDSVLVASGIHAKELGVPQGSSSTQVDVATLDDFMKNFDAKPTFVIPGFSISQ